MNLNDWEFLWRCQPLPVGPNADVAALKQTFEQKHRRMQRTFLVRDFTEVGAGLIVVVTFSLMAHYMPGTVWPIYVANALTVGVTAYFFWERIRARRNRLGADAPVLAKIETDIRELRHQRRLLLNIWRWYLGPLVAAWTLVIATSLAKMPPHVRSALLDHPIALGFVIGYVALCGGLFWCVGWMNRRAVNRQIDPRLAELEKLQAELSAT